MKHRRPLLSGYIRQQRYQMALPYLAPSVLDIGCGQAYLPDVVPDLAEYVGVDIHPLFLDQARQRYPVYEFYQADLEQGELPAPLAGRRFGSITLIALLEHLAAPEQMLHSLLRVLSPAGRVIATTPTPLGHLVHRGGSQIGLFYREAADDHKSIFDRASLVRLFQAAGLKTVSYQQFAFGCNQLIVGIPA